MHLNSRVFGIDVCAAPCLVNLSIVGGSVAPGEVNGSGTGTRPCSAAGDQLEGK